MCMLDMVKASGLPARNVGRSMLFMIILPSEFGGTWIVASS